MVLVGNFSAKYPPYRADQVIGKLFKPLTDHKSYKISLPHKKKAKVCRPF